MTKPVLISCSGFECLDFKEIKAHIISYQEAQTIPDCVRYIIGVSCYNFKSQMNILASF